MIGLMAWLIRVEAEGLGVRMMGSDFGFPLGCRGVWGGEVLMKPTQPPYTLHYSEFLEECISEMQRGSQTGRYRECCP